MPYRDDVQCFVQELTYNFESQIGRLMLEVGSCTDMTGCIGLFKRIDPDVRVIITFSGIRQDSQYRLEGGVWQAFSHPRGTN